jgi:fatty acid desaturase
MDVKEKLKLTCATILILVIFLGVTAGGIALVFLCSPWWLLVPIAEVIGVIILCHKAESMAILHDPYDYADIYSD